MDDLSWHCKEFDQFTITELYAVLEARVNVFVVEQNCPYPELSGGDEQAIHIWAQKQNQIAAYCRVFAPGIKYEQASIGRVLTTLPFRQFGLGKELIERAIQIIEERFKTRDICISAQDYLLKFYGEFGFKPTGKSYLEDGIPHSEMRRE